MSPKWTKRTAPLNWGRLNQKLNNMKNTLRTAQFITLISGIILGTSAFVVGANMTMDNPIKENMIILIGFSELLVIFSLISIFTTKNK